MADTRVPEQCQQCGQVDDHPKHRYLQFGRMFVFHHDCTPQWVIDDMTHESFYDESRVLTDRVPIPEDDWHPATKRVLAIRAEALKGRRGPKLLAHIQTMNHTDEEG